MMKSSENQPFSLNSIIDPSLCRHLKQKFTRASSKQIPCAGTDLGLRVRSLLFQQSESAPVIPGALETMVLDDSSEEPATVSVGPSRVRLG